MTITVYSLPQCTNCAKTIRSFKRNNIPHSVEDYRESDMAQEIAKQHNFKQAPIVIAGETVWCGFDQENIDKIVEVLTGDVWEEF